MKTILLNLLSIAIAYFIWWVIKKGDNIFSISKDKLFFSYKIGSRQKVFKMYFLRFFSKKIMKSYKYSKLYFELQRQIKEIKNLGYNDCTQRGTTYTFIPILYVASNYHNNVFKGEKNELLNEAKKIGWFVYECICGKIQMNVRYSSFNRKFTKANEIIKIKQCMFCQPN